LRHAALNFPAELDRARSGPMIDLIQAHLDAIGLEFKAI
jgi:hypothetical protein